MTYPDLASFADDLSDRPWAENLLPAAKAGAVVQGRLIQMPMTAAGYAVYYNTKIFSDLNLEIPTTYEQFLEVCKKIKDAGITPLALGMKDGFVPNSALSQFLIDFYANQSPDYYTKLWSGETKISDNVDFKNALEKFLDLHKNGYFSPGVLSEGYEAVYKEVADGKSAMIIQGSWLPSFATGFNKDVQLASFILPNPSGNQAGSLLFPDWNLGLNKNSKNKEAAIQFLDFLAQSDSLAYLSAEWKAVPAFKDVNVDLGDSQKGYLEGLANYTSYLPWYPIVADPNYEFVKVLTDVMSNKTSLTDALKKYDDILQQNKGAMDALYKQ
jgi:ABC-type glycerol-3-phosphate transport system substrate-binding protein